MKSIMHSTKNSLPVKNRIELIDILNISLASSNDLYMQLKQAHWNIKGSNFIALHKLFDEIAEQIENQTDIIAERITSLGGTALGTIQATNENSILKAYPITLFQALEHIEHLTHNIATFGELSRKNINLSIDLEDFVTSDLYTALAQLLDKNLWFIEAHIQK